MADEQTPASDPNFAALVGMLGSLAMQHLGKLVNPATGKAEVHLEGAEFVIDLVESLERKTRGNRTEEEGRLLAQTLTSLRFNYVEAANAAPAAPPPDGTATPGEPSAAPAADAPGASAGAAKPPGDEARFHKSYG
jgi:hypothetical protein